MEGDVDELGVGVPDLGGIRGTQQHSTWEGNLLHLQIGKVWMLGACEQGGEVSALVVSGILAPSQGLRDQVLAASPVCRRVGQGSTTSVNLAHSGNVGEQWA